MYADRKRPPTKEYILRTDAGAPDHFRPPPAITQGIGEFGPTDSGIRAGFLGDGFDQLTNGHNYQHSPSLENHNRANHRSQIISRQPTPIQPPPYTPSCPEPDLLNATSHEFRHQY